jgi:hypothetical protein
MKRVDPNELNKAFAEWNQADQMPDALVDMLDETIKKSVIHHGRTHGNQERFNELVQRAWLLLVQNARLITAEKNVFTYVFCIAETACRQEFLDARKQKWIRLAVKRGEGLPHRKSDRPSLDTA